MTEPKSTEQTCPSCGERTAGKFCEHCGSPLLPSTCRSCGAALSAGARFCRECGTAAGGGAANTASKSSYSAAQSAAAPAPPRSVAATWAPWGIAAIAVVGVIAYAASISQTEAPAASPMAPFANGGGAGGAPPDLSTMTPRERAGRLYDRVMRYVEEGKADSAQFFAPMALTSFELLGPEMDVDARYDYGRVASETGSLDVALAQADTILRAAPTHLLGLSLAARTAALKGDKAAAAKYWATFMTAKDAELKKALPEYQMHANDIELSTRLAQGGK
jgi:hypothetical protein